MKPAKKELNISTEVQALLDMFVSRKLGGKLRKFNNKEFRYAMQIHEQLGNERARQFVSYGIVESQIRWPDMETFIGLSKYYEEFKTKYPPLSDSDSTEKEKKETPATITDNPTTATDYNQIYAMLTFSATEELIDQMGEEDKKAYDSLSKVKAHERFFREQRFVDFDTWMQEYKDTTQQPSVIKEAG